MILYNYNILWIGYAVMTNAELVVLSLIAEQPRHGYEIEIVIEDRGMREWTEVGFSVYRLTPQGHEAWRKSTIEALSAPVPYYSPFRIGLSNLPGLSTTEALSSLHQYREALAAQLEHVRERWTSQQSRLPYHVDALFDLSLTLLDAELSWVSSFIQQLEQKEGI
jgi:DNA-binding PadR family transcriptional regulator